MSLKMRRDHCLAKKKMYVDCNVLQWENYSSKVKDHHYEQKTQSL